MTEQQREDNLLADLLDLTDAQTNAVPPLTRREEQALLLEAYRVGTPTLSPSPEYEDASHSFLSDIAGIVRRYPVPAVLAGAGLALLLTRRRR